MTLNNNRVSLPDIYQQERQAKKEQEVSMEVRGTWDPLVQEDQLDREALRDWQIAILQKPWQGRKESRDLMENLGDQESLG